MGDESRLILAVDRNKRNLQLLSQFLNKEGYQTLCAHSLEEFDRALTRAQEIAMALVDLSGFDRSIWERCEQLRNLQISFLILSPKQSAAIQQESLAHGAEDMLVKPLVVSELLGTVRSMIGK